MACVIYNCRECRRGRRTDYPKENRAAESFYREQPSGARVYPGDPEDARCPAGCGNAMRWNYLAATLDPSVACTSVCEMARGHSCTCSCGGQNHGRAWS